MNYKVGVIDDVNYEVRAAIHFVVRKWADASMSAFLAPIVFNRT